MIDHLTLLVTNYHQSLAFYRAALEPLGYAEVMELRQEDLPSLPVARTAGLGPKGKPVLWLRPSTHCDPTHVAFSAPNRRAVAEFHAAATRVGGRDNGAPGLRPQYHGNYFAAFVLDPDGYNVEAVCHSNE